MVNENEARLSVNGVTLDVHQAGEGETAAVFLHCFGGSGRTWQGVTTRLRGSALCIAPDLRGFGASDAPEAGYSVQDNADDVYALVTRLGLTRWILVAHSMGAKFACAVAARRPAGLRELIVAAPSPPTPEPMDDDERARLRAGWGSEASARETLRKITARPLESQDAETAIADHLRASHAAWNAWLDAGSREDIAPLMGEIEVPVWALVGGADQSITPDLVQREILQRVRNGRMTVVPDCGHLLPLEAPGTVADVIRSVL